MKLLGKVNSFLRYIVIILALLSLLFIGVKIYDYNMNNNKITVNQDLLISTISKASELTTAKLSYKGVLEYEGKGTALIDKSEFLMVYQATARIGIDVKEIKIEVNDEEKKIYLTIPDAKIQEVKVDPTSIKYFNEKFTLLNFKEKEDANIAQAKAEEEAWKEFEEMGVIEFANNQAFELIKGILDGSVPASYEFIEK